MTDAPGALRRFVLLPAVALAAPAAITLATLVLFWTYPMSVLAVLLFGVAIGVLLKAERVRTIALVLAPALGWGIWLLLFPLSQRGYAPALSQFVALNLAVYLAVVIAIRAKR